jgi:rhamnosyltransferase subunit B
VVVCGPVPWSVSSTARHVLIVTLGSGGDVHPYLAIGRALRRRGVGVSVLTNPHFAGRVASAGLEFLPFGTEQQYLEVLRHPDLVHPFRSPFYVFRELILERARALFAATRQALIDHHSSALLAHHVAFGAVWAAQRRHVPVATGTLAPIFWLSRHDPSVYGLLKRRIPNPLFRWRLAASELLGRRWIDGPINAIRHELGLPAMRNAFRAHATGSDLPMGLWSASLRGPMADDPASGLITGDCVFDGSDELPNLPRALREFLDAGEPPIIFTLGTSVVHHGEDFYALAARAAGALGRRCVLVGANPQAVPSFARAFALCVPYAPFSALLPLGCCTVQHGGVGTTHASARAGRPQVVVAFANDEFDNADRIARLGAGVAIHARRLTLRRLAESLDRVLVRLRRPSRPAWARRTARTVRLRRCAG